MNWGKRLSMALDRFTAADILDRLAKDRDPAIRKAVAGNPNAPATALSRLATDSWPAVRQLVAVHRSAPPSALAKLARNKKDIDTRRYVARNPSTPAEVLAGLAGDPDAGVRYWVAWSPNLPLKALEGLASDPSEEVRQKALEMLADRGAPQADPQPQTPAVSALREPDAPAVHRAADGTMAGGLWEQPPSEPI
ncbi:MAG: hypothetical protein QM628_15500 [Propionicimonas sp.]